MGSCSRTYRHCGFAALADKLDPTSYPSEHIASGVSLRLERDTAHDLPALIVQHSGQSSLKPLSMVVSCRASVSHRRGYSVSDGQLLLPKRLFSRMASAGT